MVSSGDILAVKEIQATNRLLAQLVEQQRRTNDLLTTMIEWQQYMANGRPTGPAAATGPAY